MLRLIKSLLKVLSFSSLIACFLLFNSCGVYKKTGRDNPVNDADKRRKNMEEGRGITLGGLGKNKGGDFVFASSNEMWRAAISILDFVPLSSADYGGGILISDWYTDDESSSESYKITVVFLSNEIRADGLDVKVHKKICSSSNSCKVIEQKSNLNREIKLAILKRAARIKTDDRKKIKESDRSFNKDINTDRQ
jgi:hypothetical protein|tara:strand:- start:2628 stop:3209 length:582 start_codon:yes stop_codon:yes gene_type:complete